MVMEGDTTDCDYRLLHSTENTLKRLCSNGVKQTKVTLLNNNPFTKYECKSKITCYQWTLKTLHIIFPAKMCPCNAGMQ
jgi:hypothetical protein